MNTNTVIFLHIPKTGGRSLQNILLRRYSSDQVVINAHGHLDEMSEWPEERKRAIKYLQGHFIYGAHEYLPQECSYITMLREPVDRVISHYYFIKRSPDHPLNKMVLDQGMSLESYVTSGVCDEVSNDQARLVAGVSKESAINVSDMLKIAKQNIDDKFIVAGLVERFDETLMLLKKRLGLRNIFYGIRNQTVGRPHKEQIPEHILALINERNSADIELYAYANDKLAEMIEDEGAAFIRDLRKFKLINRPYSELFFFVRKLKHRMLPDR